MKRGIVIGATAGITATAVGVILVVVLLVPSSGPGYQPTPQIMSLTVNGGSWDHIGATLYQGDSWAVDFTCQNNVKAYLMTWDQFNYFYNYGSIGGFISYKQGTSGHFDFTQSSTCSNDACNTVVVFMATVTTTISITTTENH